MNKDHIKIESDDINLIVEKIIQQIDKYINNENKFFSLQGLQKRYDLPKLDRRTLIDMSNKKGFPKPLQFSEKRDIWLRSEVKEWEDKIKKERN